MENKQTNKKNPLFHKTSSQRKNQSLTIWMHFKQNIIKAKKQTNKQTEECSISQDQDILSINPEHFGLFFLLIYCYCYFILP